ncbi:phage integrase SAM-like domain-containing protein, partial [Alistipes ihumii]
SQFRSPNIRFEEIEFAYLQDFEFFLRKAGNTDNSIATKFSVFKAIYNKALAEELFAPKVNPFVKFKTGRLWTATRKRAITKEELRRITGYSGLFESASSLYCGNPIGKCSPRVTR